AKSRRTSGWTICSRSRRAAGSANTMLASASRSSSPPGARTSAPNRSITAACPGVPGATAWRASRSASKTTAPRFPSRRATVDLPDPIPPVSPTSSTDLARASFAPLQVLQDRLERDVLLALLAPVRRAPRGGLGGSRRRLFVHGTIHARCGFDRRRVTGRRLRLDRLDGPCGSGCGDLGGGGARGGPTPRPPPGRPRPGG